MKILKYNSHFLLVTVICLLSSISTQAQTLHWGQITPGYYVYDMLYDGEQNLYFTGSTGHYYIWRSSDLGATWTQLGSGYLRLYRIAIDSAGVLWGGCDPEGGIYKSTDQGDSWTNTLPSNDRIFSIAVSPNNWIWAGTYDGKVVYSSDHGNTWERDTITNNIIWSIAANNLNYVFAGNGNGKIYRTTDLGTNWELVCDVPSTSIRGIVVDDSNVIYANRGNKRLISYDNGTTWTIIGGPSLESLYLDKYHNFYAGPGHRSLDNCINWTEVFTGSAHAFAFIDSLVFAGTSNGVFLYDPSYEPYIGDNYFPLALGNKWQFNSYCETQNTSSNVICYVERDTTISDKKYYLLQGTFNDWVRYDNEEDKLFVRWNDSDYVNMDYTLNVGSDLTQLTFNTHEFRTVHISAPTYISIFDSTYHTKSYYYSPGMYFGSSTYHSESLGATKSSFSINGPGGFQENCLTKMIRAIIYDSLGAKYYSDHVKPTINFQPVFVTNKFDLDWNFTVDHDYTHFDNNGNENFVDSVIMYSYYSSEDSTFINTPIVAENDSNSISYTISYLLDSTLMKNDYSLYYKIYAVDKGIVPEYSTKPDTGYYKLIYDPTVSVDIIDNQIRSYELKQNYPNPFNPVTIIEYSVKEEGNVELVIYDVLGKVVEKLVDDRKTSGNYSAQFNASNLSSGIYFYTLRINDFVSTKKMLLLK